METSYNSIIMASYYVNCWGPSLYLLACTLFSFLSFLFHTASETCKSSVALLEFYSWFSWVPTSIWFFHKRLFAFALVDFWLFHTFPSDGASKYFSMIKFISLLLGFFCIYCLYLIFTGCNLNYSWNCSYLYCCLEWLESSV
jgi:hypothetical protein